MKRSHPIRSAMRVAVYGVAAAVLWAACGASPVRACNTPVFRYATYNWPSAPYYVFYLRHGPVPKEDEAINKSLDGLCRAHPPANVVLAAVDVSNEEEYKKLPDIVKKAYQSHAQAQQPLYLVFSPWVLFYAWAAEPAAGPSDKKAETPGERQPAPAALFAGRLDEKQVQAIVDSPVRRQLADLLKEGNAAVLLILTGPDEEANQQAEKAVGEVLAMAAEGKFPVSSGDDYTLQGFLPGASEGGPGDGWLGSSGASPQQSASGASLRSATSHPSDTSHPPDNLKLAVLKLSRTDPAEKWLVDCLLSVEPDLRETQYAKSPMVFAVFGRGRVMLPLVGKGITTANLADSVRFLAGPCSCSISDQSAGVDLLVRCDWDAVAEALAAKDPQSAGGPLGYQEFLPNEAGEGTEARAEAGTDAQRWSGAEAPSAGAPQPKAARPPLARRSPSQPESQAMTGQAPAESGPPLGGVSDSFALEQAWKIGIWLALGAAVVLIAGLVLVARQRPN